MSTSSMSVATKSEVVVLAQEGPGDATNASPKKGFRFWMIFLSICLALFLSALENSAVSTALPTIVSDLHGDDFLWVGAAYALASTAFLPMSGGVSEIFGRRPAMLFSILAFVLGSALCGSARNMNWLIAARTLQGLGGGAILSVSSIIVSDLVPLKERGAYNGLIGMTWAIAAGIGPVVGGALATDGQWRWLFYLNLPICGVTIAMIFAFLKLPTPVGTWKEKFGRMDWIGNFLVIASTTAIVIGLTWGGVLYAWSSPRVLVPLILGFVGLFGFFVYEAKWATNPMVPISLLQNRTSIMSRYIQTFVHPLVALTLIYYVPVYFQACKDASPIKSAVYSLGYTIAMGPVIIISGISVAALKIYRPQLWFAWVLYIIATGAFTITRADTPIAQSIGITALIGVAGGIIYAATYFPVLSPLPVSENAHALAFFSFCRSFSAVWGISIGATVLQNELSSRLPQEFLDIVGGSGTGVDLAYAAIPLIPHLPRTSKSSMYAGMEANALTSWSHASRFEAGSWAPPRQRNVASEALRYHQSKELVWQPHPLACHTNPLQWQLEGLSDFDDSDNDALRDYLSISINCDASRSQEWSDDDSGVHVAGALLLQSDSDSEQAKNLTQRHDNYPGS
ncbi:major facilitator superfamily domain-containing protein [Daedaleopsis nitida]|nr:major facilitator superfamily domain-containing protein [Daedaleopsis nitida]